MEPKREKSIKRIIVFASIGLVVSGVLGYIMYDIFIATTVTEVVVQDDTTRGAAIQPLTFRIDDEIFDDTRLYGLTKKPFEGFNEQLQGITLDTSKPLEPTIDSVVSTGVGRQLIVKWSLPEYINFLSVRVYRSEVNGKLGVAKYEEAVSDWDSGRSMSYIDNDVVDEISYYYLVRTVSQDEETDVEYESANGLQTLGVSTDTIAPDPPVNVHVESTEDGNITVRWINPRNSDFWFVRVYRSTAEGKLGSVVYPKDEDDIAEQAEQYIDEVDSNTAYYYTVASVDTSLNESSTNVIASPYRLNPFIRL